MADKVLIVESPVKAKHIKKLLSENFIVVATLGHIRDLPEQRIGVYPPDFLPAYEATETGKKAIANIKSAAKGKVVYLASDPDREGEAIAWHVAKVLGIKPEKAKRVTYNEVTASAINQALQTPRAIDMNLFNAQEARRIIDRLVGYHVSPALSAYLSETSSSGRVQTPALLLLVERKRTRTNFKNIAHYGCDALFDRWKATWNVKPFVSEDSPYILDRTTAEKISAASASLTVKSFKESQKRQGPPPPFITSTIQRAATKILGLTAKEVSALLQALFDAGRITYIRTDSPSISAEAVEATRAFCTSKGWPLEPKIRTWKSRESAQGAHECIRPSDITLEDIDSSPHEKALYRLIRVRMLATQLPDAVFAVREACLMGSNVDGKPVEFVARGTTKVSPGWTAIMASAAEDGPDEDAEDEAKNPIPKLTEGQVINPSELRITDKQTSPPPEYDESSLISDLERRGIGRPATYSATLERLYSSGVAVLDKGKIKPTPHGEKVIGALQNRFSFVDLDFTKRLEELLDDVALGKQDSKAVISAMANRLEIELQNFIKPMNFSSCPKCGAFLRPAGKAQICSGLLCSPSLPCPDCGKATKYIRTEKGPFMSCVDSPKCKGGYTFDQSGQAVAMTKETK